MSNHPIKFNTQGVLLDLDGTLVDSHAANVQFWRDFCFARNINPETIIPDSIGCRISDTIQKHAPRYSSPRLLGILENLYPVKYGNKIKANKGSLQLLQKLSQLPGNKKFGIVTSASLVLTLSLFNRFKFPQPDVMITADTVTKGKPDPEPYLLAKSQLGLSNDRVVVFEDSPSGINSAKKAGCTVIGIASKYDAHSIIKLGADVVINDFTSVDIGNYDPTTNTFDLIIKDDI